ncbi:hypothetical protein D7Y13_16900 [Corallococcus praedator]|uniref:Uncharacterized protein n=1 Tax=Corallococcus praedator TaxID=2316724 RepID=A0ABX9QHN2_9BACT|nr:MULTISPECIES: hypothetical protein [Corallococcus]RKI07923.1 hypothetical protein D7Y13_16900 [Corallococcus praedator]
MLGLLLAPAVGLTEPPNVGRAQDLGSHEYTEPASTSPSNAVGTVPDTTPSRLTQNLSMRQITPDVDRMRQVTGPVVKRDGLMLFVRDVSGPVVPLDMSALQINKLPQKGQEVVAVYQVEGKTNNVALSLDGEKQ